MFKGVQGAANRVIQGVKWVFGFKQSAILSKAELELMKKATKGLKWGQLWGTGPEGAASTLEKLKQGQTILLPPGIGTQNLEAYKNIALSALAQGAKENEVQRLRLEIIEILLGGGR